MKWIVLTVLLTAPFFAQAQEVDCGKSSSGARLTIHGMKSATLTLHNGQTFELPFEGPSTEFDREFSEQFKIYDFVKEMENDNSNYVTYNSTAQQAFAV